MFESIYKKRKNPVFNIAGWALLGLVCMIFIFVGYTPDVSFMGSGSAVAQVNGDMISYTDFSRYYERAQEGQNNKKLSTQDRARLQKEVVDNLVNRTLILQLAKNEGIGVSVEEIRDFLMQIPQFQDQGKFSVLRYKELLRAQGLNESRFEEKIVEDLLVQKVNGFYMQASSDNKLIEKQEDEVSKIKMNLQFIKKGKGELVSDSEITPADVDAYIKSNPDKINKYYKDNISREFSTEESIKAQHILIKITPEVNEAAALKKIKEVAAQLKPDNFTEMAKKYSEDPGSKTNGGDLGYFSRGRMVKEFEEVGFSSPIGKISEPFKTSFGYHILKVNDKKEGSTKELKDVEKIIATKLIKEEKKHAAVKDIQKSLKEGDEAVQKLLAAKKWNWEDTGPFGMGDMAIPKIGDNETVLNAALTLHKPNETYKDLIEKDGFYYLVKLKSIEAGDAKAATAMPNMDFFKQFLERQKSYEIFQAWMEQMRNQSSIKINDKVFQ